ncbi:hypothetical protein PE066_04195 [Ramlibacter tataouinensis]|uniref:hypothetical protein n=1 Tax=Ramlibacter tataouinensis TaxID=94132 RepID=UPI0022F3ABA7|nr:hypothetical protein [Ramlibacter tataouinensis]WBY02747.1 hypothetical protein PE066_04195 [Ramlibacter tataouinensis]
MQNVTRRAARLTLAALLGAAAAAHAVPMPAFEDPKLAEWARLANAEMERYLANPQGYFAMPAQAGASCELPPEVLSRIIGVRLPGVAMSEEERKVWARTTRGMPGMKPMEYADVVVRPTKAECSDGKPAGSWAGWVEFTMVNNAPGMVIRTRMRKYIEVAVAPDGQRNGAVMERMTQISHTTDWADPATADLMRKNPGPSATSATFVYNEPGQHEATNKGLTLSRVFVSGSHGGADVTTTVTLPIGPKHFKTVMYNGTQKANEFSYKDGRPHGLQVGYPYRTGMGIDVPASSICWENGEQIKTTQCNAN